jgi:hypothetical protein
MTDSQIITIAGISKGDIVNGTYNLNLSNEQIATRYANPCIAVIGGMDGKGKSFSSLRLFKNTSLAEKYIVDVLNGKCPYDYVQVQIQEIIAGASYD